MTTPGAGRRRKRVIFFGDSICHGQHVSVEKHFVVRLAADYNGRFTPEILVENRSINGNTSRQSLERVGYDVTSQGPDLVYVQFGLNDCNVWETDFGCPRVSADAFRANLKEIVEKVRAAGAAGVIVATNHPCRLGQAYEERLIIYNDLARDVAAETGALVFDVRAAAKPFDTGLMLMPDGIHLSEAGHAHYFESLRPLFVETVQALNVGADDRPAALRA